MTLNNLFVKTTYTSKRSDIIGKLIDIQGIIIRYIEFKCVTLNNVLLNLVLDYVLMYTFM